MGIGRRACQPPCDARRRPRDLVPARESMPLSTIHQPLPSHARQPEAAASITAMLAHRGIEAYTATLGAFRRKGATPTLWVHDEDYERASALLREMRNAGQGPAVSFPWRCSGCMEESRRDRHPASRVEMDPAGARLAYGTALVSWTPRTEAATPVLLIALGWPLIFRLVPRNWLYGMRTPRTLWGSEDTWYRQNVITGVVMVLIGAIWLGVLATR
jgi:hypothetical protein